MSQARGRKDILWVWGLMGIPILFIAAIVVPGFLASTRPYNVGNASTSLKTITSAQADFRANDRDGDGIPQFWRPDVAGLYVLRNPREGLPIKLIELSVAAADDRPISNLSPYTVRSAKAGYWFRALLHEDEESPSPDRFAVVAFPDTPSDGKWMFIVDEENTIYRKKTDGRRGIERYPKDPLKAGWEKLD